jgi:subtilisin family serine protease
VTKPIDRAARAAYCPRVAQQRFHAERDVRIFRVRALFLIVLATLPSIASAQIGRAELLFVQPNASAPPQVARRFGHPIEELYDKVSRAAKGVIDVIAGFRLDDDWKPEGYLKADKVDRQRVAIKSGCSDLTKRYADKNVKVRCLTTAPFAAFSADADLLQRLDQDPRIVSLELNSTLSATLRQTTALIGATSAWMSGYDGTGYAIAVADSGVDTAHPFFSGKVLEEACFSAEQVGVPDGSLCPNGEVSMIGATAGRNCTSEGCFHGTHVAGIAVGNDPHPTNGAPAIYGVARGASLIPIQIFHQESGGIFTNNADLGQALDWVNSIATPGRPIPIAAVNLSNADTSNRYDNRQHCTDVNHSLFVSIQNLRSKGIAVIAGSGNNFMTDKALAPGCIQGVIWVGATTKDDAIVSFSNTSPELDLLAPGEGNAANPGITSSVPPGFAGYPYPYATTQGTSMAAPHVAGAVAVMRQKYPSATPDAILQAFVQTGVSITENRLTPSQVQKRINLGAAINYDLSAPTAPASVAATGTSSHVDVGWIASSDNVGVDHYVIFRRASLTGTFAQVGITSSTTYNDSPVTANAVYQYEIQAVDATGNLSPMSNNDFATTISFSNDPAVAGSTSIRATDITELRNAIAVIRAFAGLSAATWTDSSLAGLTVNRTHIQELRDNLDGARSALGLATGGDTDPTITPGSTPIKAIHINAVRSRAKL